MVMKADGTMVKALVRDVSYASIDWSPDGSMVCFAAPINEFEEGIFLVNAVTKAVMRVGDLTSFEAGFTSCGFSPDGTRLLVVSASSDFCLLFTVDLDGTDIYYLPTTGDPFFGKASWQPV